MLDEFNKFRLFVRLSSNEIDKEETLFQGFHDFNNQIGFSTMSGLLKTLDLIKHVSGSIDYLVQEYGIDLDELFLEILKKNYLISTSNYTNLIYQYLHDLSPFSIKHFYELQKIDDDMLCLLIKTVDFTNELRLVRNDFRVMFLKSLYEIPNTSNRVKQLIEDELSVFNTAM